MRTVGVDLAAEPKKTALAVVNWCDGGARVEVLDLGVSDAEVVTAVLDCDRGGIDAPFGWPDAFVEMVGKHHAGVLATGADLSDRNGRRPLTKRRTDLVVQEVTGIAPLSVSADLIAHVALRCAGILAKLQSHDVDVGRVDGRVVETYPAAALRQWGFQFRGYKRPENRASLELIVNAVLAEAEWLDLGDFGELCRHSDDAFDAVLAALVARAVAVGSTASPSEADRSSAEREGWIHVPTGSLAALHN